MLGEKFAEELLPGVFQVKAQSCPALKLYLATEQVGLEQGHSAADVASDQMRVDDPVGQERRPDRRPAARMQVRETNGEPEAFELGGSVELAHRLALDPRSGRSNQA